MPTGGGPTVRAALGVLIAAGALMLTMSGAGHAQESGKTTFLGHEIDENRVTYVVTRDVNVREKPETGAKRVGGLKVGEEVVSPGRYQGWIAVERDGKPLGFAYFKYLQPFIDGALAETVTGETTVGKRTCSYRINFSGKTQPEGEAFSFADYEVSVSCKLGDETLSFSLFAFMTEGPYARGKDTVHQIGVDLLAIAEDFDHVLSSIVLYDHAKQEVWFDQITLDEYVRKSEPKTVAAKNVAEAVEAAVRITLAAWNDKVWEELAKVQG
ncbi:MAG: SH3 domain-containing protein [Rhodospirillales bacterium]